jgi:DNA invertase Pin-like site-specific DNA recombinase
VSGTERAGLEELINYARPNDLLCVVRLDRLGRSLKELLETVEYLKEKQIGLMSLEEKIDTSSAAGELIFHVFDAIAHFERRLISERTKDGIKAARLKGKKPGRPAARSREA